MAAGSGDEWGGDVESKSPYCSTYYKEFVEKTRIPGLTKIKTVAVKRGPAKLQLTHASTQYKLINYRFLKKDHPLNSFEAQEILDKYFSELIKRA